ncbi:MAG: GyrI-like domain-containing protein [Dehalococcoidales bacterium]|nr:MAG: GyrI-like domain-containing protein [Dehalococcoidales bacterium]
MEPRLEKRDSFRVLGVEDDAYKIDEVDPGFSDLWMNRFMSRHDHDVQPYSIDGAYYAVWFDTTGIDISKGSYLAGMAVRDGTKVPDGWVSREVLEAEYAVFETTLRDVGDATEYALDQWSPWPDYELDDMKPRFDLMPPDTTGPWTPVTVWIPVKRKT